MSIALRCDNGRCCEYVRCREGSSCYRYAGNVKDDRDCRIQEHGQESGECDGRNQREIRLKPASYKVGSKQQGRKQGYSGSYNNQETDHVALY